MASTFYQKNDSAQIMEEWRIAQDQDSIRVRRLSRQIEGKAEITKKYQPPLDLKPSKRRQDSGRGDPLMAVVWELLSRIRDDSKAYLMIDGKAAGESGNLCYVIKFLANNHIGSLLINSQTADLERIEWAYGKSFGVFSSGEKSVIALASVDETIMFPVKLIFNERSRKLLSRTGTYTEIAITDFHREKNQ
jgi:hypothetical protein